MVSPPRVALLLLVGIFSACGSDSFAPAIDPAGGGAAGFASPGGAGGSGGAAGTSVAGAGTSGVAGATAGGASGKGGAAAAAGQGEGGEGGEGGEPGGGGKGGEPAAGSGGAVAKGGAGGELASGGGGASGGTGGSTNVGGKAGAAGKAGGAGGSGGTVAGAGGLAGAAGSAGAVGGAAGGPAAGGMGGSATIVCGDLCRPFVVCKLPGDCACEACPNGEHTNTLSGFCRLPGDTDLTSSGGDQPGHPTGHAVDDNYTTDWQGRGSGKMKPAKLKLAFSSPVPLRDVAVSVAMIIPEPGATTEERAYTVTPDVGPKPPKLTQSLVGDKARRTVLHFAFGTTQLAPSLTIDAYPVGTPEEADRSLSVVEVGFRICAMD